MSFLGSKLGLFLALTATLCSLYGPATYRQLRVFGILDRGGPHGNIHGADGDVKIIPGTRHCEDVHLHAASGLLFTACEGQGSARLKWFPPTGNFDSPESVPTGEGRGELVVVDPEASNCTLEATTLTLTNFDGPFVTHGIDILTDPANPSAIYIHAINHAPRYPLSNSSNPSEIVRSKIEIFHHLLGTRTASHLRSIYHPLIRTPNDIYSLGPGSLLVTNDHAHRSGHLRHIEDVLSHSLAPKSNIIHIRADLSSETDDTSGINASIALGGLHNPNGLGHGPDSQILVADAAGGTLHLSTLTPSGLSINRFISFESTIDNPSFYASSDPAKSGYIIAGLASAHTLAHTVRDPLAVEPVIVWYLPTSPNSKPRVLFQDDGHVIRSASAAVVVERRGETWLFVTGFLSEAMVAVRVEL